MLELLGLLVHVVPGHAHDVGQESLDHPVTADDVLRVLAALRSEVDGALAIAHDVPVALQPPEHLVDRGGRQLHRLRQVGAGHRKTGLEQPKEAL